MNLRFSLMTRVRDAVWKRFSPLGYARSVGVRMGHGCRLINVSFSTEPYLVRLGNHVSATATRFETHDGGVWVFREDYPKLDVVKGISVGDNVFIGYGCIILPGVTIGNNVVIGAGAVVSKDIPDNSVAVGVPAKVVRRLPEYLDKCLEEGASTKHLSGAEKRNFYLQQSQ